MEPVHQALEAHRYFSGGIPTEEVTISLNIPNDYHLDINGGLGHRVEVWDKRHYCSASMRAKRGDVVHFHITNTNPDKEYSFDWAIDV